MAAEEIIKAAVGKVITGLMNRVMEKVMVSDPFLPDKHKAAKPLYAALVPDEIFKGAHFERRFVTPFGAAWEALAASVAAAALGISARGYAVDGTVNQGRLQRIEEVLNSLEHGVEKGQRVRPDWDTELKYILQGKGEKIPVRVICDLYVENVKNKKRYAFEIKAPLPNSDQTKVSKQKILKLYAMEPRMVDEAYYALPYNPYGKREAYRAAQREAVRGHWRTERLSKHDRNFPWVDVNGTQTLAYRVEVEAANQGCERFWTIYAPRQTPFEGKVNHRS